MMFKRRACLPTVLHNVTNVQECDAT